MDEEEKVFPDRQKIINFSIIGLFFVGIFILAIGVGLMLFKDNNKSSDIQIIDASPTSINEAEMVVDVGGAVRNPGVYKLSDGARVNDAVSAAGGLAADADRQQVNLAAKVSDGQKIYVRKIGEAGSTAGGSSGQTGGEHTNGSVNINNASSAELDTLPGVGPVTASKIISLRPYGKPEDLVSKKAVSQSVFDKIKDLISY